MTTPTQTPPRADSRARPAITWALWAPGRLRGIIITAWAALTIAGIAGAIAITGAAQDATTPPATHAPPTAKAGGFLLPQRTPPRSRSEAVSLHLHRLKPRAPRPESFVPH